MSFNASKCHVLSVTRKTNPIPPNYTIHNQTLENVTSAKYLGVEISNDLSWGTHINQVCNKANKTSAFLYRNLRGCRTSTQTTCYKTIVRPLLEYASPVWDPPQEGLRNSLEMVQRRAARRILHDFRPTTSASGLVARLELDPLKLRRTSSKATAMYKIVNGLVDAKPEKEILVPVRRNNRGHNQRFMLPFCRTESLRSSFFHSGMKVWNSLPQNIINSNSPQAFRSSVEGWLRMHN